MISVEQLNVEFGTRPLFHDVSYVINDHDRIALVGKNGAGKSTMLKIICGIQKPTSGTIGIPNECEIGYLPQVMKLSDDTTVIEETRKAFSGRNKMQEELKKMEQEMADRTDYDSDSYMQLVDRFTQEHERYQLMGGDNYEADIERTLTGLGFDRTDFDRPTREFSGGWRMRIELAKILLRKPDVLLLDDIHFIAGKDSVQEEFFNTFNALYQDNKQIIVTCDRPIRDIKSLEDRIKSRLTSGLACDIQMPDFETRVGIIRRNAKMYNMNIDDDTVFYIAEQIKQNVRQLEGVIKRLTAYKEILDDVITIDSVKRAIKDVIRIGTYTPTPDIIIRETARYYSLKEEDLRGQNRSKNMTMARQVSMYLMRSLTGLSLKDIGTHYEDRNHATVLSSIRKVEQLLKNDPFQILDRNVSLDAAADNPTLTKRFL